jgi:transketolase
MAIAEVALAARFNRPGYRIVDHYTYVLASDGDLEEGISSEAGSEAGHLRLGKLIVLYADNHITIEGSTEQGQRALLRNPGNLGRLAPGANG